MNDLVTPPAESPNFLDVPVDKDPIIREALLIRGNDLASANRLGFENAMLQLQHSVQAELEQFYQNVIARVTYAKTQCELIYTDLSSLAREIKENPDGNSFAKTRFNLEQEIRAEIVDTRSEGLVRYHEVDDAGIEYMDFRDQNDLKREPMQPQNLVITIAILIALVIVEVVVNGFFFMDLAKGGLFGGVFEAFLFAPFNVLFASIFGYYSLRYIRHFVVWKRVLAYLIGLFLLLFVLGLNAYLAALRLSLKKDTYHDIPGLLQLIFSPRILEIMDYKSLGILVLGLVLAGFACWKAYNLKDPYPGYDEVARRKLNAENAVLEQRRDYLDELTDMQEDAVDELNINQREFVREVANFQKLVDFVKAERNRFETICAKVTEAFSQRQSRFHQIYSASKKLESPELVKSMEARGIEPREPEVLRELEDFPKKTVEVVFEIESMVRRYVNDQEKAMAEYTTEVRESALDLFEEIRHDAAAL